MAHGWGQGLVQIELLHVAFNKKSLQVTTGIETFDRSENTSQFNGMAMQSRSNAGYTRDLLGCSSARAMAAPLSMRSPVRNDYAIVPSQ